MVRQVPQEGSESLFYVVARSCCVRRGKPVTARYSRHSVQLGATADHKAAAIPKLRVAGSNPVARFVEIHVQRDGVSEFSSTPSPAS